MLGRTWQVRIPHVNTPEVRAASTFWLVTQTITDPEDNMDWRIAALVDLAASDKEKRVVLTVLTVDAR